MNEVGSVGKRDEEIREVEKGRKENTGEERGGKIKIFRRKRERDGGTGTREKF